MSEIYESTALAFTLPDKGAQEYALDLHRRAKCAFEEAPSDLMQIPEELRNEEFEGQWHFDVQADGEAGLFITVEAGCEFHNALCSFIQHLLKRFDPAGFVQFEWSRTCSRPLPTCFSG